MDQLGGDSLDQIGATLGTGRSETLSAVQAALPMLMGAMARNAQTEDGASALSQALGAHDGSILDDLMGFLGGGGGAGSGAGILGHLFGNGRDAAAAHVAQSSGISLAGAAQLLAMLAPLVMGVLGRAQRDQGLDTGGLADLLGREHEVHSQRSPGLMDVLGQVLGGNQGGGLLGEMGGLLGGLLKGG